jgi:hypothetical protein
MIDPKFGKAYLNASTEFLGEVLKHLKHTEPEKFRVADVVIGQGKGNLMLTLELKPARIRLLLVRAGDDGQSMELWSDRGPDTEQESIN